MKRYLFMILAFVSACSQVQQEEPFWLGADLGWITEYES